MARPLRLRDTGVSFPMRFFHCSALLFSLATCLHGVESPELDRLRANYHAAIERATAPITQNYLGDLEKQRDAYARATKLDAANAVQAEINNIKGAIAAAQAAKKLPPKAAAAPEMTTATPLRWFAGKTWQTDQKTKWIFSRSGTGEKVRGTQKICTFTWKLLDSGKVELTERTAPDKPSTTTFLQFKSKSEAFFGFTEDNLPHPLHAE